MFSIEQLQKILLIGLAGGVGTVARFGLGGWVQRSFGAEFPWGTLAVNILGCFIAGMLWSVCESKNILESSRLILFVGFVGGFTTFSAFALETTHLFQQAVWFRAFGNIAIQNISGIAACFLGMSLGRGI